MKYREANTISSRFANINIGILLVICLIAGIGMMMLYSAANGSFSPWVAKQLPKFILGIILLLGFAVTDLRFWQNNAYILYGVSLFLLLVVEFVGKIGMGAQRWIDLYIFHLQPSELVRITLILALARYFGNSSLDQARSLRFLIPAIFLVFVPAILVMRQPDLGTALLLILSGGTIFFLAGMRLWKILAVLAGVGAAIPFLWHFLHDYQKNRVMIFLNPELDPLGAGYHIMQSKIAFGSGGFLGKGFMHGSQSHLDFLPEKQTDFIFTMFSEEFGMLGGIILIGLYCILFLYGYKVALSSRSAFARFVAIGITTILFLYVFINMSMVMGLVPVVGVPLPLVSFGGTSMLTILMGLGLLFCCDVNRYVRLTSNS